jgi:hypothetical protein
MLVFIFIRIWLFSEHDGGLAFQAPLDPGGSIDIYCH